MTDSAMSHEELSTLAAGTGDYGLLAECIATSAMDHLHEMQHAPASLPDRAAALFHSIATPVKAGIAELTPTEGGQ